MKRKIIQINEEKCDGCGICVPSCQEGALQVIDGKLRLVADYLCDGLGACVKDCPKGALQIIEKETDPYDEIKALQRILRGGQKTLQAHLAHLYEHNEIEYLEQAISYLKQNNIPIPEFKNEKNFYSNGGGCPGSREIDLNNLNQNRQLRDIPSALGQWPIQLHLINPYSNIWDNADLLIAADCVAYALGSFHNILKGKKLMIACPKLDDGQDVYLEKLVQIFKTKTIKSVTIAIMEVPCCSGLFSLVRQAVEEAKAPIKDIELKIIKINGIVGFEKKII